MDYRYYHYKKGVLPDASSALKVFVDAAGIQRAANGDRSFRFGLTSLEVPMA